MRKEGPKDRLEMISREPTWAKKVPRIDYRWFQESQLGHRRSQANFGKEGPKDRLEVASSEPTWAKKVLRID